VVSEKRFDPAALFETLSFTVDRKGEEFVLESRNPGDMSIFRNPYVARVFQADGSYATITNQPKRSVFLSNGQGRRSSKGRRALESSRHTRVGRRAYQGDSMHAQISPYYMNLATWSISCLRMKETRMENQCRIRNEVLRFCARKWNPKPGGALSHRALRGRVGSWRICVFPDLAGASKSMDGVFSGYLQRDANHSPAHGNESVANLSRSVWSRNETAARLRILRKRQDGAPSPCRRIPFVEGSCEAQPAAESAVDSCGRVEGKTMTCTKEDDQVQWEFLASKAKPSLVCVKRCSKFWKAGTRAAPGFGNPIPEQAVKSKWTL